MVAIEGSFTLVSTVWNSLWTLTVANCYVPMSCAAECLKHPDCGGFVFDVNKLSPCYLVVDSTVSDATELPTPIVGYRLNVFNENLRIVSMPMPNPGITWEGTRDLCQTGGMTMPLYHKSLRDKAVLHLRSKNFFYVNIRRQSEGVHIIETTGTIVPESVIQEIGEGFGPGMIQPCVGMGYTSLKFFDWHCAIVDPDPYMIFCVG